MINLIINDKAVQVKEGTTIFEAAKQNNIIIPHLCYLENVHKIGSCRICVVEVDGAKNLMASCITEAKEGMVFGNVLRNGTYPISVSSERIFQAIAIINYAKEIKADAVAHGSTGAGNDQIRFDLTFDVLAPEIKIITPTRDMSLTREYEIEYLRKHGIIIIPYYPYICILLIQFP